MKQKIAILFSGGKDSNYVTYLCQKQKENKISCLINLKSKNPNSYMFQTVGNQLIPLQAKALQIPLLEIQTKGEKETELQDLKKALKIAKQKYQITAIATGAIQSCYQAQRIQQIANELNLWCYNPIWQINEQHYITELLNLNFEIKIFGIFSYPFEKNILGKTINKQFLQTLNQLKKTYQISPLGEGGEYESFILNGPNYHQKIEIENIQTEMNSENSGIITQCNAKLTEKEKEKKFTKNSQTQQKTQIKNPEIIIINLNQKTDKLYELEYCNPIANIIKETKKTYKIIHYTEIKKKTLENSKKIILSGTPLKEFEYLNHLKNFDWIKTINKPILGICAGSQIIQKIYNAKQTNKKQIGLQNKTQIQILKENQIVKKENFQEIYSLHTTSYQTPTQFETLIQTTNKTPQLIKHKTKPIYASLFHPEIRNPQFLKNFINQ